MESFLKIVTETALIEAEKAAKAGEVPVCAVVFDAEEKRILAVESNRTERDCDPTAHAEVLAIRSACKASGQTRLNGLDLFVTLEPIL